MGCTMFISPYHQTATASDSCQREPLSQSEALLSQQSALQCSHQALSVANSKLGALRDSEASGSYQLQQAQEILALLLDAMNSLTNYSTRLQLELQPVGLLKVAFHSPTLTEMQPAAPLIEQAEALFYLHRSL